MLESTSAVVCDNCQTDIPLETGEWTVECPKCFTRVAVPKDLQQVVDEVGYNPLDPMDRPPAPVDPRPSARKPRDSAKRCARHGGTPAAWRCDRCQKALCNACVDQREVQRIQLNICSCGGRCIPLTAEELGIASGQAEQFAAAFAYPLQGQGLPLLLLGSLFFMGASILLSFALVVGVVMSLFLAGYMIAYVIKIISVTAIGENDPPEWPGAGDLWETVLKPFILVNLAAVLYVGPCLVYGFFHGVFNPVFWGLLAFGLFCFPMVLTAIAMFQSLNAMNPALIFRSIARVPVGYVGVCFLFFLAGGLKMGGEAFTSVIPYLGPLLGCACGLYFMMVQARVLGLLYRLNEEKLGWF